MPNQEYKLNMCKSLLDGLYRRAANLFVEEKYEESDRICHQLLSFADLCELIKAGCHLMLCMGSDNYLWHAEQAVYLYENLYKDQPGSSFTNVKKEAIEFRDRQLALARECLQDAEEDRAAIQADFERQCKEFREFHKRDPTEQELAKAHFDRYGKQYHADVARYDPQYEQVFMGDGDE